MAENHILAPVSGKESSSRKIVTGAQLQGWLPGLNSWTLFHGCGCDLQFNNCSGSLMGAAPLMGQLHGVLRGIPGPSSPSPIVLALPKIFRQLIPCLQSLST